jgi:hypothetical protein
VSFYVKRSRPARLDDSPVGLIDGRKNGWTGPIRSASQAQREAGAWRDGGWDATVVETTPDIRAEVRAWQKACDISHGRYGRVR